MWCERGRVKGQTGISGGDCLLTCGTKLTLTEEGTSKTNRSGLAATSTGEPSRRLRIARPLKVAREPDPSTTAKRTKLATLPLSCEPCELAKNPRAFLVDGPCGLEDYSCEQVVLASETGIVLAMFLLGGVVLARARRPHGLPIEGTRHCNVDCQSFALTRAGWSRPLDDGQKCPRIPFFSIIGDSKPSEAYP